MKRALLWLCLPLLLLGGALAQEGETVYALVDGNGELLTHIAADVEAGDEYIDQGNRLFKVVFVDEASLTATVELAGEEPMLSLTALEIGRTAQTKSVGIYVTHSDEAYEDGDGASSIDSGWTGIHDVAWALGESLEEMGVEVLFDPSVHLPHDAGAYRRSRATAVELLKQGPSALIDVHRDGIPDASEYTTEVDGEEMAQVVLSELVHHPDRTTEDVIEEYLKYKRNDISEQRIHEIIVQMRFIDSYATSFFREQAVRILVENGIRVTAYGTGWDQCEWSDNPYLVYGGKVLAPEILPLMNDSKIVLNTMTWFKAGAHDRIFNGMLAGAAVVTDDSTYLRREFTDGKELVMFSRNEIRTLPERVFDLFGHMQSTQKMADCGYQSAKEHHTWKSRAAWIREAWM